MFFQIDLPVSCIIALVALVARGGTPSAVACSLAGGPAVALSAAAGVYAALVGLFDGDAVVAEYFALVHVVDCISCRLIVVEVLLHKKKD